MTVPGVAWVGLILLLIPVIQMAVQTQWPEASYPLTAAIVAALAAVGKWLEVYFAKPAPEPPAAPKPRAVGETGASAAPPAQPPKLRRFFIG